MNNEKAIATEFVQVTTTVPNQQLGQRIGNHLVEHRLAACVQISSPIQSIYRWQDKIESADEWFCLAKVRADRFEQVATAIAQLHTYDVPEIIATPLLHISESYRKWLTQQLE